MIHYQISKINPKKLGQAADEIFRVAAWTRSELAISLRFCVGRVDAEKLAQRSSVAAWVLSCWSEWVLCHLNLPGCFSSDSLPLLNLFTGLKLVASRFDMRLRGQGCSVG